MILKSNFRNVIHNIIQKIFGSDFDTEYLFQQEKAFPSHSSLGVCFSV